MASVFGATREDVRERLGVSDATCRARERNLDEAGAAVTEALSLDRLIASLYLRATMASLEGE